MTNTDMITRLFLVLAAALMPTVLFAQISVDEAQRNVRTGPQKTEPQRTDDSTKTTDTSARMTDVDARSVYAKADRYYGRSNWTATEFDSVMAASGMDSRDGQHAAIASILLRMRDGEEERAREQLNAMFSMPGNVIDNDIAQILTALDVILNAPSRVDTVYVNGETPSDASKTSPSMAASTPQASPLAPMAAPKQQTRNAAPTVPTPQRSQTDSNGSRTGTAATTEDVDVVDRLSVDSNDMVVSDEVEIPEELPVQTLMSVGNDMSADDTSDASNSQASDDVTQQSDASPYTNDVPGNTTPLLASLQRNSQPQDAASNGMEAFEARLRALEAQMATMAATVPVQQPQNATTTFSGNWPEEYITRRCYTIEIERYDDRALAEQRITKLRRIYRRTRLAIDDTSDKPFVVIVGYYQTERAAISDIPMVSRTTRRACKVMETTIAEKL